MTKPQKKTLCLAGVLLDIAIVGIIDRYFPGLSIFVGFIFGVIAIILISAADRAE